MSRYRLRLFVVCVCLCCFSAILPQPARASVIFTLTPPVLTVLPGGSVSFVGTLENTGADEVFLNGTAATLLFPELTLDENPFFANAPFSLTSGGTYIGPFFDVSVAVSAAAGQYNGLFTIQGGVDSNAFDDLALSVFTVNVVAVPEAPRSLLLLLTCLLAWAVRRNWVYTAYN